MVFYNWYVIVAPRHVHFDTLLPSKAVDLHLAVLFCQFFCELASR
jgi:hypothetical protein